MMHKPRLREVSVAGQLRWQCYVWPLKHGEVLCGHGDNPKAAYFDCCDLFYEYALANRRRRTIKRTIKQRLRDWAGR